MTIAHNPEHGWFVTTNVEGWPLGREILLPAVDVVSMLQQENAALKAELAQLRAERKCMCGDK